MFEVNLHRKQGDFGFEATDANGHSVKMDSSDENWWNKLWHSPYANVINGFGWL